MVHRIAELEEVVDVSGHDAHQDRQEARAYSDIPARGQLQMELILELSHSWGLTTAFRSGERGMHAHGGGAGGRLWECLAGCKKYPLSYARQCRNADSRGCDE